MQRDELKQRAIDYAASGVRSMRTEPSPERVRRALRRSSAVAQVMDRAFKVPGLNARFGADTLVGLVPVVGDTAGLLIGLYPVVEAARLNVRKRIISKMLLNLGTDWLLGLVPLIDIVLDTAYKANVRNVRLLRRELGAKAERAGGVGGPDPLLEERTDV